MNAMPAIVLARSDYTKLLTLGSVAANLFDEIERASVLEDAAVSAETVRMGSSVRYRTETGAERTVELVYPADADIAAGKVSVVTPVGTALIGLSVGQSIEWIARNGKENMLTVLEVGQAA